MPSELQDHRMEALVEGIVRIAGGDLGVRIDRSAARDDIDAVITGINFMAEDLETIYRDLEQRVTTRTAMLHEAHAAMEQMAMTDQLTTLHNRTALTRLIGQALAEAARGELPPALLLLDLDSFKIINDTLGHLAGDEVLKKVSQRLREAVRNTDAVARLGGDEFAVLLPAATISQAKRAANRILKAVSESIDLGEHTVACGTSIGIQLARSGQSAQDLLLEADTALYAAKTEGRGNVKVFEAVMLQARQLHSMMATELRDAVRDDQLILHYQPVVELATGRIEGVEALVRWNHPTRGLLMPDDFIPMAEETGIIVELGKWVLGSATRQLRRWQIDPQLNSGGFNVRVNLSAHELQRLELVDDVRDTLSASEVQASDVIIEITESAIVTGDNLDQYSLNGLRKMGVRLEIDDFGTGYSSIRYLRRLPVDVVKVDRSLIADLGTDPREGEFVAAILGLIRAAGLKALAEGIETAQQAEELTRMGCLSGQGYFFSRPVPAAEITALLKAGPYKIPHSSQTSQSDRCPKLPQKANGPGTLADQ
ncbi:EAL domain-containing protein [Paenarthrobacter sp. Z7-10]|uniref:putative bifunctional diguanylate cyclase/phosphodiesterase n=1 Tax=Paenarthrobacter sp. Z7-10 TaxID=2787635 RepID=UPI0022A9AC09|nr:EAL domain-containing protein [Paenarthrobacter sp. Z7-10]MCZ2404897.1 EAL domain-containing protein [Paenarthrobacter sp. Z7-10]